ncbi:hypothetical protein [Streptomyces vastus]|uniref:Aldehyde dehydrogenase family protein n=1 Tax=Streptomyces vastus TaxID=285451 RepID=A0ABP6E499_9ACTN
MTGEHVAAKDGRYFETTEALTGEPIARVAAASADDVNHAVDAAAAVLAPMAVVPAAAFSPAVGAAWLADARETEASQRLDRELEEFLGSV